MPKAPWSRPRRVLRAAVLLGMALGAWLGVAAGARVLGPSSLPPSVGLAWTPGCLPSKSGEGAAELEKLVVRALTQGDRPNRPFAAKPESEHAEEAGVLLIGCGATETDASFLRGAPVREESKVTFSGQVGWNLSSREAEAGYLGPDPRDITDIFSPELDAAEVREVTAYSAGLWKLNLTESNSRRVQR